MKFNLGEVKWVHPHSRCIGSTLSSSLTVAASCGFEDAMAQQVKSGTSAHGALDRLQAADLPFHRTGTPRQRQAPPGPPPDRAQTADKPGQRRVLSHGEPLIRFCQLSGTE